MGDIHVSAFREFGWSPNGVAAALKNSTSLGSRNSTGATMSLDEVVRLKITGTNLKYTSDGHLKSGTITALTILIPDGDAFVKADTIAGLSFKVASAFADDAPLFDKPVYHIDASGFHARAEHGGAVFATAGKADTFVGSDWNDEFSGLGGKDTIHGGKGNDFLDGGDGNDKLFGEQGNDFLSGGPGNDTLDGGKGSDWVFAPSLSDTVANKPVVIDLAAKSVTGGYGTDTLISIENAAGGDGDDRIVGSSGANKLEGQVGNDKVDGGKGDDTITGNAGVDTLKGGAGADYFVFNWRFEANADLVKDFTPGTDKVVLDKALFKMLDLGVVSADHFSADGTPDGDDYLIYKPSSGKLFYDAHQGEGQTLIATFGDTPGLQGSDMIVANSSDQDFWI